MHAFLTLLGFSRPASALAGPAPSAEPFEPEPTPEPALETSPEPAAEPAAPMSVPCITATALWTAYDANEANAERRYAHRALYVSGAVQRVGRVGGGYDVELSVVGAYRTVHCLVLGLNRLNVAELRPGDLAMVLGRRVRLEYGQLLVDDCVVIVDDLTSLAVGGV